MNKDNTLLKTKNKVYTPTVAKEALRNLPFNYALLTYNRLKAWEGQGLIKKSFSKRYIIKVQKGEEGAFNEDILNALVQIGVENIDLRNRFGRITKKTSPSN